MTRMLGHWEVVLGAIATNFRQPLGAIPLLTAREHHQLLVEWNDTTVEYPQDQCIHQLFEAQVKETPDAVAVVFGAQELTYRELNQRANQLAHHLQGLGITPETLVGICVERSVEMVVGLLGILKAGGVYVPLEHSYPQERIAYILSDVAVPVLLTQQSLKPQLPNHVAQVLCLDDDWEKIAQHPQNNSSSEVSPENLAYVMYTSGSTGEPKGVSIVHQGVVRLVKNTNYVKFSASDVFLQLAPISFDASTFEIWGCLLNGGKLIVMPSHPPVLEEIGATISAYQVTTLWLTAALFQLMIEQQLENLKPLRQLLAGGDVLSSLHVQKALNALPDCHLINGYGPTENTTFTCCYGFEQSRSNGNSAPIGRPIANTQVYILDKQLQPVPIGVVGELYIGGAGLARGYLNRPDLTAEKFIPNPFGSGRLYKTGDLTRYLPNGNIEFLGRTDHQVKIRGFRIELGEVEAILSMHPQVQQVVVVVRTDHSGDKRLIAYVVSQNTSFTTGELRAFLKEKLPDYMVPSAFVKLEVLPLTPNGKVDRQALPVPEFALRKDIDFIDPRTPTENSIAAIFASVLGLEKIGIHNNFFEFGGHSLLATQAIAKLRGTFQIELTLRDLFDTSTVAELDQRIHQALTGKSEQMLSPMTAISRDSNTQLPLSWSQERLWFLDQLDGANAAYNIPVALNIKGQLDVTALEWAIQGLIERHEILRTTFPKVEGRPIQAIAPVAELSIPIEDLSTIPADQHPHLIQQRVNAEAQGPFNLAEGSLLRLRLLRLAAASHVLLLTLHHTIFDAWSSDILIREFVTLYEAYQQHDAHQQQVSPLVPFVHQYADYAYWQRHCLTDVLNPQLRYWKQHLSGPLPLLRLPLDYPQATPPSYQGARCSRPLTADLSQALKTLSQSNNVTLFMTLLAAFNLLLSRQTDQTDIIVGTPIAGRQHPGTTELIGFFVNTLPLRVDLAAATTFQDLLDHVREVTLAAYSNQDVPFEKLVEVLQPQRSLSRHPLFEVMLNLIQDSTNHLEIEGLDFEVLELPELESKFWMTLCVKEQTSHLQLELVYRQSHFSPEHMEVFLAQFETLLEQIVATPEQVLQDYSLITPATQPKLPDPTLPLNGAQLPPPTTLIAGWAEAYPEDIALTQAGKNWTYRELVDQANAIAQHLVNAGIQSADVVALYGKQSFELIAYIIGISLSGAVLLTLDPNLPPARLQLMVEQAKAKYLICLDEALHRDWMPDSSRLLMGLEASALTKPSSNALPLVSGNDPAYIFFTSGSTGVPKGVLGMHKGITHFVNWQREQFGIVPSDRIAQLARLSFDALLRNIYLPLTSGATLCLPNDDALSGDRLLPWLERERISVVHTVPTVGQYWVAHASSEITLSALRVAFFAGEPLTETFVRQWRKAFPAAGAVVNFYGATETTLVKSYYPVPEKLRPGIQSAGWSLPHSQNLVLNVNNRLCGVGEIGQIVVRTPFRTLGYINLPPEQPSCFVPNPFGNDSEDLVYYTGDRGRYLPDGCLEILGRMDDQFKVRGIRVQPGEIESLLNQHPEIGQSVVAVRPDTDGNPALVAYIVGRSDQDLDYDQLHTFLVQQLPTHLIPAVYVTLVNLPRTASGKVDRNALPSPDFKANTPTPTIAPRTPTETTLAGIIAEILQRDEVGVYDNFFALGGHSLQATQVIARIQQAFELELSLRVFFEAPKVAALAEVIAKQQREQKGNTAVPALPTLKRARRLVQRSAEGKLILPEDLK
ncbi:MAG: amino acid adenylation domain-containing protein [Symploca sp. SIO2C1]|nr:amino acid adenylation domain-containing protein [Symploca sp. SIO2C1]